MDISSAAMLSNFGGTWSYPGLFLGFSPNFVLTYFFKIKVVNM